MSVFPSSYAWLGDAVSQSYSIAQPHRDFYNGSSTFQAGHARSASRPRVTMACKHCRQRKVRCDGQKPKCGLCTRLGKPCDYVKVTEEENAVLRDKKRAAKARKTAQLEAARATFHQHDTFPAYHPYRNGAGRPYTFARSAAAPITTTTSSSHAGAVYPSHQMSQGGPQPSSSSHTMLSSNAHGYLDEYTTAANTVNSVSNGVGAFSVSGAPPLPSTYSSGGSGISSRRDSSSAYGNGSNRPRFRYDSNAASGLSASTSTSSSSNNHVALQQTTFLPPFSSLYHDTHYLHQSQQPASQEGQYTQSELQPRTLSTRSGYASTSTVGMGESSDVTAGTNIQSFLGDYRASAPTIIDNRPSSTDRLDASYGSSWSHNQQQLRTPSPMEQARGLSPSVASPLDSLPGLERAPSSNGTTTASPISLSIQVSPAHEEASFWSDSARQPHTSQFSSDASIPMSASTTTGIHQRHHHPSFSRASADHIVESWTTEATHSHYHRDHAEAHGDTSTKSWDGILGLSGTGTQSPHPTGAHHHYQHGYQRRNDTPPSVPSVVSNVSALSRLQQHHQQHHQQQQQQSQAYAYA